MQAFERARGWLADVFVHHHAERLKTNRAIERKAMGVTDVTDLPYPGAVSGSANTTTNNSSGGWLKGALLASLLLAGGGAAGLGVSALTTASSAPTVTPATPPAASSPAGKKYQAIYEQQQPDGSWKTIKTEPLK